jgi:uncharacterized membrane protein
LIEGSVEAHMNLVIDPIQPWSYLGPFLSSASAGVATAAVCAGLAAFVLPILVRVASAGRRRRMLRGGLLALGVLLGWVTMSTWGTTSGAAGPLQGLLLTAGLLVVPLGLAGLGVATYFGTPGASRRRLAAVLALRAAALLLVLTAILRPALGFSMTSQVRSLLLVLIDSSRSMTIQDEADHRSRWDVVQKILEECGPEFERLRDLHQIDVEFYRFHADTAAVNLDSLGEPDGPRTDTGAALHWLYEQRDGKRPLRGLLLLSDGADNGTPRIPALAEAARWRGLPCPLQPFALGKPTTSDRQSDVAITAIAIEPTLVPVKGRMTVKLLVDAPGFENTTVRARLFLDGQEMPGRDVSLPLTTGNEIKLECNAPAKPGEVKVTVRLDGLREKDQPPAGDLFPLNNQIETFATVTREGISVLLVDKQRVMEPQSICDALSRDPRIRVFPVWLRGGRALDANAGDLFQFDRQQYDVIVLGDVTAQQLQAVSPGALKEIERLVSEGAGFLMLGGYSTFGNGDWRGTEVERLLPVDLSVGGQVEKPVRMLPTEEGLRKYSYVLRLTDGKDVKAAWENLPELEGMVRLKPSATGLESVLAESQEREPILVAKNYGKGRCLAFAGDTTHRWIRTPEMLERHGRFWRQMAIWLARQEDAEGSVWARPDTRRLPARSDLGFSVGVRSRGGVNLADGTYQVEVAGPDGARTPVTVSRVQTEDRGTFTRTDVPGEYVLTVKGSAKDPSTGEEVSGEATARFIVYDEDVELVRRAADHDFLRKLATAGGGQFHRAEELNTYLRQLENQPLSRARPRLDLRPDWKTETRSPFLVVFFLVFVAVISGEWLLRRRWGMV